MPTARPSGELTLAQLSILVTLLDQGPIRMTELAAHERVRTPTTTVAIRRLEKLGLVKRSRDPSDLRAVLVEITPKGHAQHAESLAARRARSPNMLRRAQPRGSARSLAKRTRPAEPDRRRLKPTRRQPSQSSTAAAVHDCCMLPSGSPVNGS